MSGRRFVVGQRVRMVSGGREGVVTHARRHGFWWVLFDGAEAPGVVHTNALSEAIAEKDAERRPR